MLALDSVFTLTKASKIFLAPDFPFRITGDDLDMLQVGQGEQCIWPSLFLLEDALLSSSPKRGSCGRGHWV